MLLYICPLIKPSTS